MALHPISKDTCVVRNTAGRKGRSAYVGPGLTATRFLHYGRIVLDHTDRAITFATHQLETGLIGLKGSASVTSAGKTFTINRYDSLYIPRHTVVEVKPGAEGCDLAEVGAPVDGAYPLQFVPFASIREDPALHMSVGGTAAQRDLNILIGKNVDAGRIMAGVTFSAAGNWTSWPPHEHATMLEEAYLYVDMPAPAFGLQLVYTDSKEPELATVVREGDVVMIPQGYHPNVAAPGGSINFLWMMAAMREREDRRYGVVNVQPEFHSIPSGLDKAR